jgi:hypothetical protein
MGILDIQAVWMWNDGYYGQEILYSMGNYDILCMYVYNTILLRAGKIINARTRLVSNGINNGRVGRAWYGHEFSFSVIKPRFTKQLNSKFELTSGTSDSTS